MGCSSLFERIESMLRHLEIGVKNASKMWRRDVKVAAR